MRDPNRIGEFCDRLKKIWACVPDWRFGQLMVNALGEMGRDPFFPEDDAMIEYLEAYITRVSGRTPQC